MSKEVMQRFRNDIEKMRDEVAKALPKGVDPDRFIRTAITTVQMRPDLLEANRSSLFGACMQAAKDGLLPDDKEATIQIYNTNVGTKQNPNWQKVATYMPMVRGIVDLMYKAGALKVDAAAVYERDHFVWYRGDDDRIEHRPDYLSADPGPVVAVYAIVKLASGETKREVMPRRDIEKVREASKQSNSGPWVKWYDQQAIKSVLKRVYKQMPRGDVHLERLFQNDNEREFEYSGTKDITPIAGEGVKAIGMDHLSQPVDFTRNNGAERVSSKVEHKANLKHVEEEGE